MVDPTLFRLRYLKNQFKLGLIVDILASASVPDSAFTNNNNKMTLAGLHRWTAEPGLPTKSGGILSVQVLIFAPVSEIAELSENPEGLSKGVLQGP